MGDRNASTMITATVAVLLLSLSEASQAAQLTTSHRAHLVATAPARARPARFAAAPVWSQDAKQAEVNGGQGRGNSSVDVLSCGTGVVADGML